METMVTNLGYTTTESADKTYFTISLSSNNNSYVFNTELSTAGLTPAVLRVRLQGLVDDLDKSRSLWDSSTWK
jgi:hypothetical protein